MAEHGVVNAVLAVEETKHQPQTAIEQETAEQDQRRQLAESGHGSRDVPRRENKGRNDICGGKNTGRDIFLDVFSETQLPDQKRDQRQEEQPQQDFLDDAAVEDCRQNAAGRESGSIAVPDLRQRLAKGPIIQAEQDAQHNRGQCYLEQRAFSDTDRLPEPGFIREKIPQEAAYKREDDRLDHRNPQKEFSASGLCDRLLHDLRRIQVKLVEAGKKRSYSGKWQDCQGEQKRSFQLFHGSSTPSP